MCLAHEIQPPLINNMTTSCAETCVCTYARAGLNRIQGPVPITVPPTKSEVTNITRYIRIPIYSPTLSSSSNLPVVLTVYVFKLLSEVNFKRLSCPSFFTLQGQHSVMSRRIVSQVKLILSSVANNNNKYWHAIVWDDGTFQTKWGRVGVRPTSHEKANPSVTAALAEMEKKKGTKLKDGYQELAVLMSDDDGGLVLPHSDPAVSTAEMLEKQAEMDIFSDTDTVSPDLRALVRSLAQANIHTILEQTSLKYNARSGLFSTPLGLVTQGALDAARVTLGSMAALVADNKFEAPEWPDLLNKYLMLVPRDIGRYKASAGSMFPHLDVIQEHAKVLDALETSLQMATTPEPATATASPAERKKKFDVVLTPSPPSMLSTVSSLFSSTSKTMHTAHTFTPVRVYDIEIKHMKRRWESKGQHVGNIMRLWHGTRVCNLLSILHSGFEIPPQNSPHVTGRMFGNGIYSSSISTKALNYSIGAAPGQHGYGKKENDNVFMFLMDVAMGNPYIPASSMSSNPPAGYDSTWAKPSMSHVLNDEMIVYDISQVNPVHLVEFKRM
jgi:poly [ADP-ribose] polymerase